VEEEEEEEGGRRGRGRGLYHPLFHLTIPSPSLCSYPGLARPVKARKTRLQRHRQLSCHGRFMNPLNNPPD
jgi:hypothetical protein